MIVQIYLTNKCFLHKLLNYWSSIWMFTFNHYNFTQMAVYIPFMNKCSLYINSNCLSFIGLFTPKVWVGACKLCLYCHLWLLAMSECMSSTLTYSSPCQFCSRHVWLHVIITFYCKETSICIMHISLYNIPELLCFVHPLVF